jgi:hypothetical protein
MAKVDSATAAAGLRASFQGIQFALVVSICGSAPFGNKLSENIFLGDVVISKGYWEETRNRSVRKDTTHSRICRGLSSTWS